MPYKLNKGVYLVRCRHPHCTFNMQLEIDENIMGMTEEDVETESRKFARDMAHVKHDSLHGRHHTLQSAEIRMVSGTIQLTGAGPVQTPQKRTDSYEKEFMKGDVIIKEGDDATVICEVLQGFAYPMRNRRHKYALGDCFGVAALLPKHSRMTDVVAGADKTKIGFYALPELNKRDPRKASLLLNRVIEDTLNVIGDLEQCVESESGS
jgi:hypothetical protein